MALSSGAVHDSTNNPADVAIVLKSPDGLSLDKESLKNVPKRKRVRKNPLKWDFWLWTFKYEDVPEYLQDNDFIRGFYRPQLSWGQALASLFKLHNETGNVWTHLLGFLAILGLAIWFALEELPENSGCTRTALPKWPQFVYLAGALWCLGASWTAHLLCCLGQRTYKFVWRMDHVGILIVQSSEFFPFCYYFFHCLPPWVVPFYLAVACVLASLIIVATFVDKFQTPAFRVMRSLFFTTMAVFGFAPIVHASILHIREPVPRNVIIMSLVNLACMGLGAVFFASRFPERYFPHKFDLIGNSHNIMHTCIVAGFVIFHFACRMLWQWRSTDGSCDASLCSTPAS